MVGVPEERGSEVNVKPLGVNLRVKVIDLDKTENLNPEGFV